MSFFSTSCAASVLMGLYVLLAMFNLYQLMYPLCWVDTSLWNDELVHPWWEPAAPFQLQVFLSRKPKFDRSFLDQPETAAGAETMLLWQEDIRNASSLSKSILVTTNNEHERTSDDPSFRYAQTWLEQVNADMEAGAGILATLQGAGQGIESTSILLTLYQSVASHLKRLLDRIGAADTATQDVKQAEESESFTLLQLPSTSPIWEALLSNRTVHVHVVVIRQDFTTSALPEQTPLERFSYASRAHALLGGHVPMVKFEPPTHLPKPGRLLYKDILFLVQKYVLKQDISHPPWDMAFSQPEYYEQYSRLLTMKQENAGYPYWKPEGKNA